MAARLLRTPSGIHLPAALFCALLASSTALAAPPPKKEPVLDSKSRRPPEMEPAVRIPVEPLGYAAPSRFYLTGRFSSMTLDFIDSGHLLFTFRKSGLMQRLPDEPEDDMDQVIHAVVLDAETGKQENETTWRMHDRDSYLWAIGNGKFLVRQRGGLYVTDEKLGLRPYMKTDGELQAVLVSPSHRMIAVEAAKYLPAEALQAETPKLGDATKPSRKPPTLGPDAPKLDAPAAETTDPDAQPKRKKQTQVTLVKLPENTMIAHIDVRAPVSVSMLPDGLVEASEGKAPDDWIVRTLPLHGSPSQMGEVRSSCDPTVTMLSETEAMVSACPGGSSDHAISVLSTKGGVLWEDRWQPRYIWPSFAFAENGTRFAYGSLELNHTIDSLDPFSSDDVLGQVVGVFDTHSGKLELVKTASPEISAGHNFALSADGTQFAILREGAIEIYRLPSVTAEPSVSQAAHK